MQKFKYKFTSLALVFIILGMISGLACVVLNVIRFVRLSKTHYATSSDYMSITISIIIGIAAVVILFAVLLNSYYAVQNKDFVARWGFFANKIPVKEIKEIRCIKPPIETYYTVSTSHTEYTSFSTIKKRHKDPGCQVIIYYSTDNFFVINAKRTDYENVIAALMSANSKIVYIENSENGND